MLVCSRLTSLFYGVKWDRQSRSVLFVLGRRVGCKTKVTQSTANSEEMSVRLFHTLNHHTIFLTNSVSINMCRNRKFFFQFTAHGSVLERCKEN